MFRLVLCSLLLWISIERRHGRSWLELHCSGDARCCQLSLLWIATSLATTDPLSSSYSPSVSDHGGAFGNEDHCHEGRDGLHRLQFASWLPPSKKRALRKDHYHLTRIDWVQDLEFNLAASRMKPTPDGQFITASVMDYFPNFSNLSSRSEALLLEDSYFAMSLYAWFRHQPLSLR